MVNSVLRLGPVHMLSLSEISHQVRQKYVPVSYGRFWLFTIYTKIPVISGGK